ncbi:helix-turn-helix domain-containing protein [Frankia sp. CNm7]|uniref:Helix-turn-helix domain-containing protein n=1 Tax=Frankia nepalensis TaxID=1836974 RepID=A0A937RB83_9ACTN|nr:helix-turn-helix domain-containing protein [Frankia nepalensis]MBL7494854.1 helix-turn-helix domain-containing protein [Frankia nepalensis]MBL7512208.1 helix-turn-helix domain-containing protein [Frankia nepalensis]MBL7518215.1 helix-turn-helix domain-containing protein [Frankia nepalensis]MBL7626577.1 helix-turn-helix domain-containing protein [Frankia nepalensis]
MPDDELWTTGDIAERLGITTERVRQLSHRDGFPAPAGRAKHIRYWRARDIEDWIEKNRPDQGAAT